jgi:protein involved in polysaccharide export with SLBB domain
MNYRYFAGSSEPPKSRTLAQAGSYRPAQAWHASLIGFRCIWSRSARYLVDYRCRSMVIALMVIALMLTSAALQGAMAQQIAAPPVSEAKRSLQPGDLIRLKIWREPDLSGDFRVDEAGLATFPKIGSLPVSRLSPDSLKSLLVSSYARFLQNPSVEVIFLRRVNVLGAVKSPGLYDVDPTMTVADVIAMAGGVTPEGKSKKVELHRPGQSETVKLSLQSRLTDFPPRSGDQLRVPQRSWLARNGTVVAAGITAAAFITAAVVR